MKKNVESNIFFEVQKYCFVFESMLIFFFKWSYWQRCFNVAQRCENRRWKWQCCFDVVQRCSVQRWKTQRCFNVVLRCKFQLFQRCATSWRHIDLKTTLNRRWNVCWVASTFILRYSHSGLKGHSETLRILIGNS